MKKLVFLSMMAVLFTVSCSKDKKEESGNNNCGSSTAVPSGLQGAWVNGYVNSTQVIDRYNGQYLENTWQSGRYLYMEADGKNATLYTIGGNSSANYATQTKGTVSFEPGSTLQSGTFTFNACSGYYKGYTYSSKIVDRPATAEELKNNLTLHFDYEYDGTWFSLWFVNAPDASPTSFRKSQ